MDESIGNNGIANNSSPRLFAGKQFWLSQNIPQRNRFKEMIQRHGGIIRLQEKDAGIMLVDHARKNLSPNTFSYQYVENSIRNGRLENLEAYRAGPSAARPVGATHIPRRGHRVDYTLEDDQILWDWVQKYEKDPGAPVLGYSIFKELEEKYPRHSYQSYRDRYRKKLRGNPRPGGPPPRPAQQPAPSGDRSDRRAPPHSPTSSTTQRPHPTTGPPPNTNQALHPPTTAPSSNPEDRKRKRTTEDEAPASGAKEPDNPIQKKRAVDTTQPPPSNSHQAQLNEPESRAPVPPSSTNGIPSATQQRTEATPPTTHHPETVPNPFFLELPFLPSSPESEEDSQPQDIDAYIDARLRSGRAKSQVQVIEALHCASMDPDLADKVLDQLIAGKGIPEDIPGVWTRWDDKCMEGKDARDIERVLKKHGMELFEGRWDYLGKARAAGLSEM